MDDISVGSDLTTLKCWFKIWMGLSDRMSLEVCCWNLNQAYAVYLLKYLVSMCNIRRLHLSYVFVLRKITASCYTNGHPAQQNISCRVTLEHLCLKKRKENKHHYLDVHQYWTFLFLKITESHDNFPNFWRSTFVRICICFKVYLCAFFKTWIIFIWCCHTC